MLNLDSKIAKIQKIIENRYGIVIDNSSDANLIKDMYDEKKNKLSEEINFDDKYSRLEYGKIFLISEAARLMVLREIQPRPGKNKKKKDTK